MAGRAKQTGDAAETSSIVIRRDNVLDGMHGGQALTFEDAGYAAAIAQRRTGEAQLHLVDGAGSAAEFDVGYRWLVTLDELSVAVPRGRGGLLG